MVDPVTANLDLAQPTRGSDVGTWDLPMNGNTSILDLCLGNVMVIGLNNSNVTLASSQFQSKTITFNSTLTGSVIITFPTSFIKSYEIQNLCTGSSAFTVTLQTTAGGNIICAPPGEIIDCINDGSNLKYKNLGRIGEYWDYAGSSVPAWVSGCTVPPYLNCAGGTFSATTYPALATILGSTTLPDSRGRYRAVLDQSATRLTSAVIGFSPNTVGAAGSSQTVTLSSQSMPPIPITDPGHSHNFTLGGNGTPLAVFSGGGANGFGAGANQAGSLLGAPGITMSLATTNITAGSTSPTAVLNIPPTYIGGLTLIRAG